MLLQHELIITDTSIKLNCRWLTCCHGTYIYGSGNQCTHSKLNCVTIPPKLVAGRQLLI